MKRYVIIQPDGSETTVVAAEGQDTLTLLQEAVGGWIEHLHVLHEGHYRDAYVNEEGKMTDLPYNEKATKLWWAFHQVKSGGDVLVGPMVVALQPED